jgi:hypothetical protein
MANAPKQSEAAANAAVNAKCALLDGGTLKIYTAGSGVPAAVADAITDQVLLATLPLNGTAFGPASGGSASANTITDDSSADATGTAAFFRLLSSGGAAVFQGTVGTSGCDLNMNSVAIQENAAVKVTALTVSESLG